MLHQYFYPELAGSAIRLTDLAVGLQQLGIDITVWTGLPSYTDKKSTSAYEEYKGIQIERLEKTRFSKNILGGRVLNMITFFISALIKIFMTRSKDLLFIGADPPFLGLAGWLASVFRKQRYILHVTDYYPDMAVVLGYLKENGTLYRLWCLMNRLTFSRAEVIITLGNSMKEKIQSLLPASAKEKVIVIQNWEDPSIRPIEKTKNWFVKQNHLEDKTVVLFSGNLGLAYELVRVIETACWLQQKRETNILFLFIGEGAQKAALMKMVAEKKLANVIFFPYQQETDLPYTLTAGDIALISMKPLTQGLFVPGKFYTALAAGLAVLGIVPPETEIANLIDRFSLGLRVETQSPEQIGNTLLKLHKDPFLLKSCQHNARKCFEKYFSMDRALKDYHVLLTSLLRE